MRGQRNQGRERSAVRSRLGIGVLIGLGLVLWMTRSTTARAQSVEGDPATLATPIDLDVSLQGNSVKLSTSEATRTVALPAKTVSIQVPIRNHGFGEAKFRSALQPFYLLGPYYQHVYAELSELPPMPAVDPARPDIDRELRLESRRALLENRLEQAKSVEEALENVTVVFQNEAEREVVLNFRTDRIVTLPELEPGALAPTEPAEDTQRDLFLLLAGRALEEIEHGEKTPRVSIQCQRAGPSLTRCEVQVQIPRDASYHIPGTTWRELFLGEEDSADDVQLFFVAFADFGGRTFDPPHSEAFFSLRRRRTLTAEASATVQDDALLVTSSDGSIAFPILSPLFSDQPESEAADERRVITVEPVVLPLDTTGVADWDYLNPRRPRYLFRDLLDSLGATLDAERRRVLAENPRLPADRRSRIESFFRKLRPNLESLYTRWPGFERARRQLELTFENRTSDRTYNLEFDVRLPAHSPLFRGIPSEGLSVLEDGTTKIRCSDDGGGSYPCGVTIVLRPTQTYTLPPVLFEELILQGISDKSSTFKISVNLFADVDVLANPTAYLSLEKKVAEPASETEWSVVTSISREYRPVSQTITAEQPFTGEMEHAFRALARLDLLKSLGSRARGEIAITFKEGVFGEADTGFELEATKYKFSIFANNGMIVDYGLFDFAGPADAIAVNESGEGARVSFRQYSVAAIVKRESATGVPDDENDDARVFLFQAKNLSLRPRVGGLEFLRSNTNPFQRADLLLLYGRERAPLTGLDEEGNFFPDPDDAYRYLTAGGQVTFSSNLRHTARRDLWLNGSLAYYYSRRDPDQPDSRIPEAQGNALLLKSTLGFLAQPSSGGNALQLRRSLQFSYGFGSGDDRGTRKDESYLGETAEFAPDVLFLSRLVTNLVPDEAGALPAGLANKHYFGLVLSENNFSPLYYLARWPFGIPESDIVSRSTILKLHHYRFAEPVRGAHAAGYEANVEFLLETPKGVTGSVTYAKFFPAKALDDLFDAHSPWSLAFKISTTLK